MTLLASSQLCFAEFLRNLGSKSVGKARKDASLIHWFIRRTGALIAMAGSHCEGRDLTY